jgi:pantothenate kinase
MERKLSSKLSTGSMLADEEMFDTYHEMAMEILQLVYDKNGQVVIGVTGPPGAGKSTVSQSVASMIPDSIVIPMDGFHFTKEKLRSFEDPDEAFKRRGASWTFDGEAFVRSLKQLKENHFGRFPSFDHCVGDPFEDDIVVTANNKVVIVEGNYLLLNSEPWKKIKDILDFTYFIECDEETILKRLVKRHMKTGLNEKQSIERIETNDMLNANEINETKSRANKVIPSV